MQNTNLKVKLQEVFDQGGDYVYTFFYDDFDLSDYGQYYDIEAGTFDFLESAQCVDSYGGEGQGETYYSVWKFVSKDGEVAFVQFDGSYQSYSGSEFDDYFFVEPKQVEVTQYVKAK